MKHPMNGYVPAQKVGTNAKGMAYGGKGGQATPMPESKNLNGTKYCSGCMK